MSAGISQPEFVVATYGRLGAVGLRIVNSPGDAIPAFTAQHRQSVLASLAKRGVDVVGALTLAILFLPIILLAALVIRLDGKEIIYRHRRVGRHGQMFGCLKFRTMVPDAEQILKNLLKQQPQLREEWMKSHKLRFDPRITVIGRFLRKTSLDELPQLWNVLVGEMSLVGPRPVTRDELSRYGRRVSAYLSLKPGLSGLWQVFRRDNTTYRRRVAMDVYYTRNRNVWFDVYIMINTVGVVFGKGEGSH